MMRSDMGKQMRGPRVPMPSPVQGGGMTRPALPGKGMMQRQAFKKGGMVSTKGHGCCNGGKKSCKIC